ncbi:hypothetical protein KC19_VG295900 [Ceratodon purpureus]|uniref:Uncharacterized protein n=1 Tax=Ceratodon purpureus TaxID=3225 RepID=A0A8T0HVX3_CERPU|nr:hypothetical protein KC19_VG295900 [Ceratodon purpureus]
MTCIILIASVMAMEQQLSSNNGTTQFGVTPQELHKERKPSKNPLIWFRSDSSSSFSVENELGCSGNVNLRARQAPLVVDHFPTSNRPNLR